MIEIDYGKINIPGDIKSAMPIDLPDEYSGVEIWFHRLPLANGHVIENAKIECTATSQVEHNGKGFRAYGYIEAPSLEKKELIDMSGNNARFFLVRALQAIAWGFVSVLNYIDTNDYWLD